MRIKIILKGTEEQINREFEKIENNGRNIESIFIDSKRIFVLTSKDNLEEVEFLRKDLTNLQREHLGGSDNGH